MRRYITDNNGLRYYLKVVEDSDDSFHVDLYRKGDWAGYGQYQRWPCHKEVVEANIYIRDDADPLAKMPDQCSFPTGSKKSIIVTEISGGSVAYRRQGLGSKLLSLVMKHATERKTRGLYGSVMKADIAKTPRLVEWYEKRGFQRCSAYPGCVAHDAVHMFVDLT